MIKHLFVGSEGTFGFVSRATYHSVRLSVYAWCCRPRLPGLEAISFWEQLLVHDKTQSVVLTDLLLKQKLNMYI